MQVGSGTVAKAIGTEPFSLPFCVNGMRKSHLPSLSIGGGGMMVDWSRAQVTGKLGQVGQNQPMQACPWAWVRSDSIRGKYGCERGSEANRVGCGHARCRQIGRHKVILMSG